VTQTGFPPDPAQPPPALGERGPDCTESLLFASARAPATLCDPDAAVAAGL